MICFFIVFKLVYLLQLTWISNINVFNQLNDQVYISCGKQMKLNISIKFHLPSFFFKVQTLFLLAISEIWPALGN
jgi:hypothetical protein